MIHLTEKYGFIVKYDANVKSDLLSLNDLILKHHNILLGTANWTNYFTNF